VSIITSISMDHQEVLGDSLAQIAWEKVSVSEGNMMDTKAALLSGLSLVSLVSLCSFSFVVFLSGWDHKIWSLHRDYGLASC